MLVIIETSTVLGLWVRVGGFGSRDEGLRRDLLCFCDFSNPKSLTHPKGGWGLG